MLHEKAGTGSGAADPAELAARAQALGIAPEFVYSPPCFYASTGVGVRAATELLERNIARLRTAPEARRVQRRQRGGDIRTGRTTRCPSSRAATIAKGHVST